MSHPSSISQGIHAHRGYATLPKQARCLDQDPLAVLGSLFLRNSHRSRPCDQQPRRWMLDNNSGDRHVKPMITIVINNSRHWNKAGLPVSNLPAACWQRDTPPDPKDGSPPGPTARTKFHHHFGQASAPAEAGVETKRG